MLLQSPISPLNCCIVYVCDALFGVLTKLLGEMQLDHQWFKNRDCEMFHDLESFLFSGSVAVYCCEILSLV